MAHSEEYFDAYRDDWWNPDFLVLMAARTGVSAEATERMAALEAGRYHSAGGCLMYLVAGRKPEAV